MNPRRLNGRAIYMIEDEGMGPVVNLCGELLMAQDLSGNGAGRWRKLNRTELAQKMIGHFIRPGVDRDGGYNHAVNGTVRALMVGQAAIETPGTPAISKETARELAAMLLEYADA